MFELLKDYKGTLIVNGKEFNSVQEAFDNFKDYKGGLTIIMNKSNAKENHKSDNPVKNITDSKVYEVKVRRYMTNYDSSFFLTKMNPQGPMPYIVMYGKVLEETKGLIKMELWADMIEKRITTCMCCGKPLSNPISQYLGIGPVCGAADHMALIESGMDIDKVRDEFRKTLVKVKWTGWIVKSAITGMQEMPNYKLPE